MINGEENLQSVLERVRKAVGLESECSELGSWDIIQILGTHSLLYLSQHKAKIHVHVGYMYRQLKYVGTPLQCVYSIVFIIPCFTMNSVVSSFPGRRTRPGNEANSDDYLHHYLLDLWSWFPRGRLEGLSSAGRILPVVCIRLERRS